MESKKIAEFAFDLQIGLGRTDVADFYLLREIGMAASLAVHIKGLGEIDFDLLRKVSDFYFDIPSYALERVLAILAEVEFVRLVTEGHRIRKIIPNVPYFEDMYTIIGEYTQGNVLNEHEKATLTILHEIYNKPENKQRLINTSGIESPLFERCLQIGQAGGLIREHRARGRSILVSPVYFGDNLDALADLAVRSGSDGVARVLDAIRKNQGWPLSLIEQTGEIGGIRLPPTEKNIINLFASEGILKPPKIQWEQREELFIFTPRPGPGRLNATNKEIYERAMALVSAARKGQLLFSAYRVHSPVALLSALRDRGYIDDNSEAPAQYRNLVAMRVARLERTRFGRWRLHLMAEPENTAALDLAIDLLETGEMSDLEVNQEARIALTRDEKYIQSVISASELRRRQEAVRNHEAVREFEQLVLSLV